MDTPDVIVKDGYIFEFTKGVVNVTEPNMENKQMSFDFEDDPTTKAKEKDRHSCSFNELKITEEYVDAYEEMTYNTEYTGAFRPWAKGDHDAPASTSTPESTILLSYSHIIERELDRIKALVEQSPEVVTEEDIYVLSATSGELHSVYTSLIERTKE